MFGWTNKYHDTNLLGLDLNAKQVGKLYGGIGTAASGIGSTVNDLSNALYAQNAGRADLASAVSGNSWGDVFNNSDILSQGLRTVQDSKVDYSDVKNNLNLLNTWNANDLQNQVNDSVEVGGVIGSTLEDAGSGLAAGSMFGPAGAAIGAGVGALSGLGRSIWSAINHNDNAKKLNRAIERANKEQVNNFYTTAQNNQARQQRQAIMNYFDLGGDLDNGVTTFNVGGSHSQNPYGGIQQGIASDGYPNTVEQGEVKYEDYIYSNRLKPSKKLLKDNNLPEKYFGLTFAELAKKLQKESEDRPNDPVSKQTLKDWMSRLTNAQEAHKANLEQKRLAKALDSMSIEDKAALMSNLMQQQEGIDLSQPMYAKGGKIYIKPENRGKFNATKARTGKTTEELTHSKNPITRKRAIFAQNAAKWSHKHDIGGPNNPPFGAIGRGVDFLLGNYDPITKTYMQGLQSQLQSQADFLNNRLDTVPHGNTLRFVPNIYNKNVELQAVTNPQEVSEGAAPKTKSVRMKANNNSTDDTEGLKFNLENLRFAPAVGAGISALQAALQPIDYSLPNELRGIASRINPISAPALGGYRRYTPYDVNLGDAENLALESAAIRANRGQNRATQGALNVATIMANQKAKAQRNLAAQQANEANRLAVDTYNLGIDQTNANLAQAYDQLNTNRLLQRLAIEQSAASAADAARTGWSNMYNTTHENLFNQLGNVGRDEWNRNQNMIYLKNHLGTFRSYLKGQGKTDEEINQMFQEMGLIS